jgi:hypothetical protein
MTYKRKNEFDRFIVRVNKDTESGCWEWTGPTRRNYGHFLRWIDEKRTMGKVHRFSYEYFNNVSRESMKGLFVCHTCDNPICVNPAHLFLGTALDNNRDKVKKGRAGFGRNKNHVWLSKDIAMQIRKTKKENPNLSYKQIGKLFNTSASQICRVINNQIWKE